MQYELYKLDENSNVVGLPILKSDYINKAIGIGFEYIKKYNRKIGILDTYKNSIQEITIENLHSLLEDVI